MRDIRYLGRDPGIRYDGRPGIVSIDVVQDVAPALLAERRKRAAKASGKVIRQKCALLRSVGPRWYWTEACEAEYEQMRRESAA